MSHFFTGVIVPKFIVDAGEEEVKKYISQHLAPYDEILEVTEYKQYLSDEDLDTTIGNYSIDADDIETIIEMVECMSGSEGGYDEEGIYYLSTYNSNSQWDYYVIGGRWDGLIADRLINNLKDSHTIGKNMVPVEYYLDELKKAGLNYSKLLINALVTPEPKWIDNDTIKSDEIWQNKLIEILEGYKGSYIVGLDCHI